MQLEVIGRLPPQGDAEGPLPLHHLHSTASERSPTATPFNVRGTLTERNPWKHCYIADLPICRLDAAWSWAAFRLCSGVKPGRATLALAGTPRPTTFRETILDENPVTRGTRPSPLFF